MSSPPPIWLRPARGARGPAPAYDRAAIAAAAIPLADAEGVEAASMRRVAAALGTSATALYRYVASKDELIDLMADAVMGERPPPRATGDWRRDLTAIARALRATLLRHPWLAALPMHRPSLGPNNLRWLEATLGALDNRGLPIDDVVALASATTTFVRGYVAEELADDAARARTGQSHDAWMATRAQYGAAIFESGAYPTVTRVMREAHSPHDPRRRERGFEAQLAVVLDGVAAHMPARPRRASRRSAKPA